MLDQWLVWFRHAGETGIAQVGARDAEDAMAQVPGAYRAEKKQEKHMEQKTVAAADWKQTGFNDGKHGNPAWPPTGMGQEARSAYREGYREGAANRQR